MGQQSKKHSGSDPLNNRYHGHWCNSRFVAGAG